MKKIFLVFGLMFSLYASSFSQKRDTDSPFRFGLQFNPLLTWNRGDNNFAPAGIKGGFEYGLNMHYFFFRNVGVETGFYMNHHGAKFSYDADSLKGQVQQMPDTAKYRYDLNMNTIFVTLPIALRFRTNQLGPVYLYGKFGADFSFNVLSKLRFSGRDLNVHEDMTDPVVYDEKTYRVAGAFARIGILVEAGIEYPISGSFSLTAGLRYNYGFTNILRDNMSSSKRPFTPQAGAVAYPFRTPGREDIRTQYLGLTVGALF
jgi:hypothetical protein